LNLYNRWVTLTLIRNSIDRVACEPINPQGQSISSGTTMSLPDRELLDRSRAELCRRLQAGEDCSAQEYLDAYPSLAQCEEYAVELIVAEFKERRRLGQPVKPSLWLERYPRWRDRLEKELSQIVDLSDSTGAGPTVPSGPDASPPPEFPQRFRKYTLLARLGGGGMGTVYRAYDPGLDREVALKEMKEEFRSDDPNSEANQRFQREVQVLFDLRHEHIIRLHDNEIAAGYYTMELLTGGSLRDKKDRFKDPHEAAKVVEKIARGVQAAHTAGIVHRDLKPANVMLNNKGEPVVADFGVARFLTGKNLTETGRRLGTWSYMAPEQLQGPPERIQAQSDVWALGVILYELVCARLPFVAEPSPGNVLLQAVILTEDPPDPTRLCPGLPRDLETIILKCLRKEAKDRYQSAEQLADDLDNWLAGKPIRARPEGWVRWTWRKTLQLNGKIGCQIAFVVILLGFAVMLLLIAQGFLAPRPGDTSPIARPSNDPIRWLDKPESPAGNGWNGPGGTMSRLDQGELRLEMPKKGLGLWEFTDTVPWERYRFSVTVQQIGTTGTVGVYLDCGQAQPDDGARWFLELSYAERNESPLPMTGWGKKAQAALFCRRIVRANGNSNPNLNVNKILLTPQFFPAAEGTLRRLQLEVTREAVAAFWDRPTPFVIAHRSTEIDQAWKTLEEIPPPQVSPWSLPGSTERVGLLCEGATCVFSDAVIEPLP
jgi:Protein kinase domain